MKNRINNNTCLFFLQGKQYMYMGRFSDNLDRLFIANSQFDPTKIFSDNMLWNETGLLKTIESSMNGRMGYYMTQSNTVWLLWRTVSQFDTSAADMSAAGFRILAFPASGEPPRGKTNNVVSEQVRHKPVCTSTEKS